MARYKQGKRGTSYNKHGVKIKKSELELVRRVTKVLNAEGEKYQRHLKSILNKYGTEVNRSTRDAINIHYSADLHKFKTQRGYDFYIKKLKSAEKRINNGGYLNYRRKHFIKWNEDALKKLYSLGETGEILQKKINELKRLNSKIKNENILETLFLLNNSIDSGTKDWYILTIMGNDEVSISADNLTTLEKYMENVIENIDKVMAQSKGQKKQKRAKKIKNKKEIVL